MARNYQYETSPRKIEPEYQPRTKKKKNTGINTRTKNEKQENNARAKKVETYKNIVMIVVIFLMLLFVSYRNSLITERFNEIQDKKSELASIEKSNGQLEVSIEGSLNLSNVEEEAKDLLGMDKLDNSQKVYVSLDTKDYTEASSTDVVIEDEESLLDKIINIFK